MIHDYISARPGTVVVSSYPKRIIGTNVHTTMLSLVTVLSHCSTTALHGDLWGRRLFLSRRVVSFSGASPPWFVNASAAVCGRAVL